MRRVEDRLRRLEVAFVQEPDLEECLDAQNRMSLRALHKITEILAPYGFNGDHLFNEHSRRILSEDTPAKIARDREIIDTWNEASGNVSSNRDAREELLARLNARA